MKDCRVLAHFLFASSFIWSKDLQMKFSKSREKRKEEKNNTISQCKMFLKDNFSIYLLNHWLSWNGLLALCDFNMFTLERKRILNKLWIIDRTSYGVILLKSHLVWMNQFHTTVFFSFSFFLLFVLCNMVMVVVATGNELPKKHTYKWRRLKNAIFHRFYK